MQLIHFLNFSDVYYNQRILPRIPNPPNNLLIDEEEEEVDDNDEDPEDEYVDDFHGYSRDVSFRSAIKSLDRELGFRTATIFQDRVTKGLIWASKEAIHLQEDGVDVKQHFGKKSKK